MQALDSLLVELQGPDGTWLQVGTLFNKADVNWFEFDDAYWGTVNRPVLGQIFEERGRSSGFKKTKVSIPRWFSHLLPEGHLRTQVAEKLGIPEVREFPMLRGLGASDLPGAVRVVESVQHDSDEPHSWEMESNFLTSEMPPELKFSLAGVQMKYSVLETGAGMTVPAKGLAGDFILKLPDLRPGFRGVPESEHAIMELGRAVGLDMVSSRLISLGEVDGLPPELDGLTRGLLIPRFDRIGAARRIHAEHFGQILDISSGRPRDKYERANIEGLGRVAGALAGNQAAHEVIRRVIYNVLIGNGDAHLKNWAISYPDGRTPQLSPAYDIVPTVLYMRNDDLGMNIGGEKDFQVINARHFARYWNFLGLAHSEGEQMIRDLAAAVDENWNILTELLTEHQAGRLREHFEATGLARV